MDSFAGNQGLKILNIGILGYTKKTADNEYKNNDVPLFIEKIINNTKIKLIHVGTPEIEKNEILMLQNMFAKKSNILITQ